jgi:hypothetical protein
MAVLFMAAPKFSFILSFDFDGTLSLIREGWQWLAPPIIVARVLCEPKPMRYYCGQVAPDVSEH